MCPRGGQDLADPGVPGGQGVPSRKDGVLEKRTNALVLTGGLRESRNA